jgi:hypothetical protein
MVLQDQLRKLARVGIVGHLAPDFGEDRLLAMGNDAHGAGLDRCGRDAPLLPALTRERPSALRVALIRSLSGFSTGCVASICESRDAT